MHSVVVLATLLVLVNGYGYYRDALPNGRIIPCDSSCVGYCEGFGHVLNNGAATCNGGGEHPNHELSAFGNAWKNHGTTWSLGMCMEDSDGDGFSNGDEMGDPCCKWVAGTTPQRTRNLANPAQKDSIPYPSCTKGEPKVTLTANLTTQSSAVININWVVPSCMCGFNVSLVNPKAANNIQATAVADPFSGGSQIFMTGLEPSTMYTFLVTGYNLAGGSPLSIMVNTPATSVTAPAAPPDLQLTSSTSNTLTLSWGVPTTNIAGSSLNPSDITNYELDVAVESDGIYNTVYSGIDTKFTVLSLVPETKYLTRVRAVNANGVGTSSAPITVITSVYNGTATSANYTSPDGAFHVGWKIDGNTITFVMTGKSLGYVAVGWGPNPTMLGSDMVVGSWDSKTGTGSVVDLWSTSHNTPSFDVNQDAKFVSGAQTTVNTTITFTRLLNTSDTHQDIIIQNHAMYLLWAIGSGTVSSQSSFAVHTNRGAVQVNFFTGSAQNLNTDKLKNAHAGLAFFAWGILIPFGSFVSRYKRCDLGVWWFRIHVIAQSLGALLTFIAFILIASAIGAQNSPHFHSTHAIFGLIMLIFTAAQTGLGLVSHIMYDKNRRKVPLFPDRVHAILGLAVMLFAYITIFLGFDYSNVGLGAWLLGAQCLLFAATAVFVYEFFDGKED